MDTSKWAQFAPDFKTVISSDGEKVQLDDPRVAHVFPVDMTPWGLEYAKHSYERRGMRCRVSKRTTAETLQSGKTLSNGRECIPVVAMLGEIYEDLMQNRQDGEITIYYLFYVPGPCQHGGWKIMFDTFIERLQLKDVVFLAWPTRENNYLGNGFLWSLDLRMGYAIGDLMDEAENVVRCLAVDQLQGMKTFRDECTKALKEASAGLVAMEPALRKWAQAVSQIPLKASLAGTPKVLIFGGGNVWWLHYEVTDYFIERGIVPKLVDTTEFLSWAERRPVTGYNFKIGKSSAEQGFNVDGIYSSLRDSNISLALKGEGEVALDMMTKIWMGEHFRKWLRDIAARSGLLFDEHAEQEAIFDVSANIVNPMSASEAINNVGKFIVSAKGKVFDGLVNLRVFNCPVAGGTVAFLATAANDLEMPFVALDVEGPQVSANQRRLLETLAVQAVRSRSAKDNATNAGRPAAVKAADTMTV